MSDDFSQVNFDNANSNPSVEEVSNSVSDEFTPESEIVKEDKSERQSTMAKKQDKTMQLFPVLIITIAVVLAGVASGWGVSRVTAGTSSKTTASSPETRIEADAGNLEEGKVYGEQQPADDWDKVEGFLVAGGLDGEGSHHILREGGPTRTVYVTSSYIDLDPFVGHQVEVQGETYAAQKAAWLMDVGLVKVVKLDATPPFEEKTPNPTTTSKK